MTMHVLWLNSQKVSKQAKNPHYLGYCQGLTEKAMLTLEKRQVLLIGKDI